MPGKKSTKKKKILAILSEVNTSPQLLAILLEAKKSGFFVKALVICHEENSLADELTEHGIVTQKIMPRKKHSSGVLFFKVCITMIRSRPSILFSSGMYANVVGLSISYLLRINRRIFIRHHSNYHSRSANYFGLFIDRLCNFLATDIVAVSKIVKEILTKTEKVPLTKVRLIHNGIDLSMFNLEKKTLPIVSDSARIQDFKIGLVSRMTSLKGIEYAACAFVRIHKLYPFTTFTVVGKFADSYNNVKKILEEIPASNYQLIESVPSIPKFLSELDVFIHVPVGREDESFGLVYVEALAMNLRCVFTISGVLNELPDLERYIYVVGYESSEEIYSLLHDFLSKEVEHKLMVPDSWLHQFELNKMAKSYGLLFAGQENFNE